MPIASPNGAVRHDDDHGSSRQGAIKPKRTQLELVSGRFLDFEDPRPEDVAIEDIAHALSQICRWGGHCPTSYSVAQHACLVHDIVGAWLLADPWHRYPWHVQWGALHHDDHEAYVGDVPTPLKHLLGEAYYDITGDLDRAIAKGIGESLDDVYFRDELVKRGDNLALFIEAAWAKPSQGLGWSERPDVVELPAGVPWAPGWSPAIARREYLRRHRALAATRP